MLDKEGLMLGVGATVPTGFHHHAALVEEAREMCRTTPGVPEPVAVPPPTRGVPRG
jgi:hypothetical protein